MRQKWFYKMSYKLSRVVTSLEKFTHQSHNDSDKDVWGKREGGLIRTTSEQSVIEDWETMWISGKQCCNSHWLVFIVRD